MFDFHIGITKTFCREASASRYPFRLPTGRLAVRLRGLRRWPGQTSVWPHDFADGYGNTHPKGLSWDIAGPSSVGLSRREVAKGDATRHAIKHVV
jgi:hypothetical protein